MSDVTDQGTPAQDVNSGCPPEARSDIPFMQRKGMPLHDPKVYDAPAPKDDSVQGHDDMHEGE